MLTTVRMTVIRRFVGACHAVSSVHEGANGYLAGT
jgi:hypothetical protein